MRKDVKRSLLLWPAAASLTITAVSWLPTQFEGERVLAPQFLAAITARPRIELLKPETSLTAAPIEIVARSEHGNRAMRLPPRVAEVFAVAAPMIKAPVLDEQQELAGLVLQSKRPTAPSISELAKRLLEGDLSAADQIARPQASSERLSTETLAQSLHPSSGQPRDSSGMPAASAPTMKRSETTIMKPDGAIRVEPLRATSMMPQSAGPQAWEPDLPDLSPTLATPASVVPKSNQALGRRQFASPALNDSYPSPRLHESAAELEEPLAGGSLNSDLESLQAEGTSDALDASQRVFPIVVDQPNASLKQESLAGSPRGIDLANPAGWPVTTRLDEQLKLLSAMAMNSRPSGQDQLVSLPKSVQSRSEAALSAESGSTDRITQWSEEVTQRLEELRSLPRLGDQRAGVLIEELGTLAAEGQRHAEQIDDRSQQIQWLGTCYAVARRVAVWQLVWEVTRGDNAWMVGDLSRANSRDNAVSATEALGQVRSDLEETGDVEGWTRYLLLDEIDRVASKGSSEGSSEERRIVSQRVLSRMQWHRLDPEQQRWLQRESVAQLADLVRPWAQDAVDYANLMHQVEMQETNSLDMAAIDVAGAVQTLRYADNPLANQIAKALDTHYRNANLRLAISAKLLQRSMPELETKTVPVNSMILGSRVRGNSRVETSLGIELKPSPDRWLLRLNSIGNVTTRTTGQRSSVAMRTLGQSRFDTGTDIEITRHGAHVNGTEVEVRGNTRLGQIDTDFDGWPLVGPLVRSIAENRYQSMAPQANRIANRAMKNSIESEIDQMLDERVEQATEQLGQLVLGPLGRLQLDPKVTDMQTTDQRLLARFRVAGDWQMAAFTPRPRAPATSLMSVQVHQSALNNTLEKLVPRGESISIRELFQECGRNLRASGDQDARRHPRRCDHSVLTDSPDHRRNR